MSQTNNVVRIFLWRAIMIKKLGISFFFALISIIVSVPNDMIGSVVTLLSSKFTADSVVVADSMITMGALCSITLVIFFVFFSIYNRVNLVPKIKRRRVTITTTRVIMNYNFQIHNSLFCRTGKGWTHFWSMIGVTLYKRNTYPVWK